MIDLLVALAIAVMSVRSANALRRQRGLFTELQVSTQAVPLIYLFPLGPLVLFVAVLLGLAPWLACIAAVALPLPGVLAVRRASAAFERSGTSRARPMLDALSVAFICGAGAIAFAVAATGMAYLFQVMAPVG